MKILVLGGYGAMGSGIVRDLVESKNVEQVYAAGRDIEKAKQLAENVGSEKIFPAKLDVTDNNLASEIKKINPDVVVNATWYEYNMLVTRAAITAKKNYVDLGGLYWKTLQQLKLNGKAKRAKISCILGMGSTPGITNVMAHHAQHHFDKIEKVEIRGGDRILDKKYREDFLIPYSIRTLMDEFSKKPVVLRRGKIQQIPPLSEKANFVLPQPVGRAFGYLMLHSELATLPKSLGKGVKEMDFAFSFGMPITVGAATLARMGFAETKPVSFEGKKIVPLDFLTELAKKFPKPEKDPEDAEVLRVDMYGTKGKKKLFVRMEMIAAYHKRWGLSAGTVDTVVPPSIVAQWLAEGKITKYGIFSPEPEIGLQPKEFFQELNKRDRGLKVFESVDGGKPKPLFR